MRIRLFPQIQIKTWLIQPEIIKLPFKLWAPHNGAQFNAKIVLYAFLFACYPLITGEKL